MVLRIKILAVQVGGARALSRALASNHTLQALRLSRAWVTDAGAIYLARGLRDNVGLHRLELAYSQIEVDGSAAVASALATNSGPRPAACPLRHLDLSHNRLGDLGVAAMGAHLGSATELRELLLQDCDIGAAGAPPLYALLNGAWTRTAPALPSLC